MRNVMKKAHEITRKIIRKGDSYKATFRLALSLAHSLIRKAENKMIEYRTSRGTDVKVEMGEGRTVKTLIMNGKEILVDNRHSSNCFLMDGYIYIADRKANKKLGATKDARVEINSELQAIFKKEEEKELKRLNRRIEAIKEVYANHLSFEQHFSDINYI